MRLRSLRFTALLALTAAPLLLPAEEEISSKEEERLASLAREDSEWYAPKNSVSVGFRVLGSGGKVHFGKLGTVDYNTSIVPIGTGISSANRVYNNGYVNFDTPRANEMNSDAKQTSPQGGRYQLTSGIDPATGAPNVVADYLSYTVDRTRVWSYSVPSQATQDPGHIALSSYSATSDGGAFEKKQGTTAGVELLFAHVVGKLTKRTEWSLVAGFTVNGINDKTAGDVKSTLNTKTDYYAYYATPAYPLPGTSVSTPYTGPSYTTTTAANGNVITTETTTPLATLPDASSLTPTTGGVTVHGKWQMKGAYFMVRLGPSVHTQLTERLGLSASLGVAGAYSGTHYTADEYFNIPDVGSKVSTSESSDENKLLTGYYADLTLDWSANDRTGIYGGLSAQKFGDYGQTLGTRTARVDLGTAVGIRGGINIKF